jgi:hypothetical protein
MKNAVKRFGCRKEDKARYYRTTEKNEALGDL